jgi:hypothetical protein
MSGPHATGVWISADFASVVRWSGDVALRHRIESTVPGRHRSTGRPPTENHPAGEGHRDEHMRTFFAQVAHVPPADDDLLLIGTARSSSTSRSRSAPMTRAMTARDESTSRRAAHSRNASSSPGRAHSPVLRPNADCPADPRREMVLLAGATGAPAGQFWMAGSTDYFEGRLRLLKTPRLSRIAFGNLVLL